MRLLPILTILLPVAAAADDFVETHFRRGFCYEMALSQEELVAAPERNLAALKLSRASFGALGAPGEVGMELEARFRGEIHLRGGQEIETTADCQPLNDGLRCVVAGRGGAFTLRPEGTGLRLTLEEGGLAFEDWRSSQRVSGEETSPDRELLLRACG